MLFSQIVSDTVAGKIADSRRIGGQAGRLCYPQVFADSDEFHFRRDDAGTGVGKLGDDFAGFGAQRLATDCGLWTVDCGLWTFGLTFLDVTTFQDPVAAQGWQALFHRALKFRIAPGAGAVIDADRLVCLKRVECRVSSVESGGFFPSTLVFRPSTQNLRWREFDFAHGHADVRVNFAGNVNAFAAGQLFGTMRGGFDGARRTVGQARRLCSPCGFERLFGCNHKIVDSLWLRVESGSRLIQERLWRKVAPVALRKELPTPALSGSGSWVGGAPASPSQPLSRTAGPVGSPNR